MIAKIISVDGTTLEIPCNTVEKQEMVENMFQSTCNNDEEYDTITAETPCYMEFIECGVVVKKFDYWKYLKNAWKK